MHCEGSTSVGESKEVLTNFGRPTALLGRMGITLRGDTAPRAQLRTAPGLYQVTRERVPRPFPKIPIVISIVHGSGARLIHCGNETRLRRSNGLSLKRTTRS